MPAFIHFQLYLPIFGFSSYWLLDFYLWNKLPFRKLWECLHCPLHLCMLPLQSSFCNLGEYIDFPVRKPCFILNWYKWLQWNLWFQRNSLLPSQALSCSPSCQSDPSKARMCAILIKACPFWLILLCVGIHCCQNGGLIYFFNIYVHYLFDCTGS